MRLICLSIRSTKFTHFRPSKRQLREPNVTNKNLDLLCFREVCVVIRICNFALLIFLWIGSACVVVQNFVFNFRCSLVSPASPSNFAEKFQNDACKDMITLNVFVIFSTKKECKCMRSARVYFAAWLVRPGVSAMLIENSNGPQSTSLLLSATRPHVWSSADNVCNSRIN